MPPRLEPWRAVFLLTLSSAHAYILGHLVLFRARAPVCMPIVTCDGECDYGPALSSQCDIHVLDIADRVESMDAICDAGVWRWLLLCCGLAMSYYATPPVQSIICPMRSFLDEEFIESMDVWRAHALPSVDEASAYGRSLSVLRCGLKVNALGTCAGYGVAQLPCAWLGCKFPCIPGSALTHCLAVVISIS